MATRKPLRRSHKKSRLGCQECKRRHIKCDEIRPTCSNCLDDPQACIYQSPPLRRSSRPARPSSNAGLPAETLSDMTSVTATLSPASEGLPLLFSVLSPSLTASSFAEHGVLHPPLNIRHMELLSHFILQTMPTLDEGRTMLSREQARLMMPVMLSSPYVVYQILALAAMHMRHAENDPLAANDHYKEAMALQAEAIGLFNHSYAEVTADNCAAMLVFSSLLSLHALADVTLAGQTDAGDFLDRFVAYLNLHRGVRAVTAQSWHFLKDSSLSSILNHAERSLNAPSPLAQGQTAVIVDHLNALLDHADMGTESKQACQEAVSQLQLVYQSEAWHMEISEEEGHPPGLVWTWPVLLSGRFTDLLMKRRPESIIILCHYAVLLHRRNSLWVVADAGRMLIEEITRFLGTFWKDWLKWPNEVLAQSLALGNT